MSKPIVSDSLEPPAAAALLRLLPAVGVLAEQPDDAARSMPAALRMLLAREAIAATRTKIRSGQLALPELVGPDCRSQWTERLELVSVPSLRPVLNGLGVLLHTNAGRAPLPEAALQAVSAATSGYNALELQIATGKRGSRQDHCRPLLRWLTGAEDALVVNNGAAAVLLALKALAAGRPVVVSRGELVEIGGGFRIPDVLAASGAQLCEVGTTNRTHLRDYQKELERLQQQGTPAAAVLQVHRSNFAIVGFETHPQLAELAGLARSYGAATIVDLGSGALRQLPIQPADLPDGSSSEPEPTLTEVLLAGADAVTCSGDKLIGGPQSGLILGSRAALATMHTDPLARALRCGSLVLSALQEVLRLHLLDRADELPALAQLHISEYEIGVLAEQWALILQGLLPPGWLVGVVAATAQVGGGTHPLLVLPSRALSLTKVGQTAEHLSEIMRHAPVPVLARPRDAAVLLDVRSLRAGQGQRSDEALLALIAVAASGA